MPPVPGRPARQRHRVRRAARTLAMTKRILIVGGGYVGMYTARSLRRRLRHGAATITVADPRGFMTFQPFLAEAAAGTIEPRHVVTSLRRVLPGTEVLSGRITRIDHAARSARFHPAD